MVSDRIYKGALAAALGLLSLATSQPENSTSDAQHDNHTTITKPFLAPAAKPVVTIKYLPPCRDPKDHEYCDLEAQWKAANSADKAAWWAVIQAIFSGVGIVGLIFSLHYTRKAVVAAEVGTRGADAALVIAVRNANAAAQLADISRESMERQLRAYVNTGDMIYLQHFDPSEKTFWWSFRQSLTNFGRTPAHEVQLQIWSRIETEKLPANFDFNVFSSESINTVIGPLASIQTSQVDLTGEQACKIRDGTLHFYIWGWVFYQDAFAGTDKHQTRFCYKVSVMGDPTLEIGPENVVQWTFHHYHLHNDAT